MAVDISGAEAKELYVEFVPVHLVRYDPQTQAIATYAKVANGKWKDLKFQSWFGVALEGVVENKLDGCVLAAAKRSRDFKKELADLKMLRDEGIV